MNKKVYDTLKWLASPGLPALAFLLVTLSEIYGINAFALAGATVAALATALGKVAGDESKKYFADKIILTRPDTTPADATPIDYTEAE